MTQDLKQIVEKEAERVFPYRSWHTAHNIRTDIDREKFIKGANFALTLNRWVKTTDRKPSFGVPVLCYCRIYGRYIGMFEQILDTGHGQWNDGRQSGVLPPTLWQPLPDNPTPLP